MSVFPAPLKEFLKVAAKSPVPVVEPVIAADLQLEVCHEDTALVFSDFSTVCNVLLEAHAIPGHNQRCFFHGRYWRISNLADFEPVGSTSKSCLQGSS